MRSSGHRTRTWIRRRSTTRTRPRADIHGLAAIVIACTTVSWSLLSVSGAGAAENRDGAVDRAYFMLSNGIDLRAFGDASTRRLLNRVRGVGKEFGAPQRARYCRLKEISDEVQWVVNDLETGETISRSANAEELYFGASVAKLFVAAALLEKQSGRFSRAQLGQLVKMIVVSDNVAWLALQRQVGEDGTLNSGREAVQAFVERMGYPAIQGFQGWIVKQDGTRVHGNELNALALSQFLSDTYRRKYEGAEVLWKIMQATRTGKGKIDKYTPRHVHVGGKTGTYSGPNASPATVRLTTIRARNHAAVLMIGSHHYGISILTNTGSSEDVAVLGGGLMREYLGVDERVEC